MRRPSAVAALAGLLALLPGCSSILGRPLPEAPPPLADMEEPLALFEEPQDEDQRRALPTGGFTGIYVRVAEGSLEEMLEGSEGVLVDRLVENSPGALAGLEPGDLLLEASLAGGPVRELRWPATWRELELEAEAGQEISVLYDRAGAEREARVAVVRRLSAPDRHGIERFREESRVGVVVRTATEVEARAAGLGPGGGAVIAGLSRGSPWREAGLRFGDLIVEAASTPVDHPQVVIDAIAAADEDEGLALRYRRDGEDRSLVAAVSRRRSELSEFSIPLLFSYESDRDRSETSFLSGLFGYEETPAAWKTRLLWLITFGGGDSEELEEVEPVEAPAPELAP